MKLLKEEKQNIYFKAMDLKFVCENDDEDEMCYLFNPKRICDNLSYLNQEKHYYKNGAIYIRQTGCKKFFKFETNFCEFKLSISQEGYENRIKIGELDYFDPIIFDTGILICTSSKNIYHYDYLYYDGNTRFESDNFEELSLQIQLYDMLNNLSSESLSKEDMDYLKIRELVERKKQKRIQQALSKQGPNLELDNEM